MWLTLHQRREARSRAPEYAEDYRRRFGPAAESELRRKAKSTRSRYYRHLYRLALRQLRRRDDALD